MNWLSHLHLGGTEELERLGHLAGDFVRGADLGELPAPIRRGIDDHRRIDVFTDAHPIVRRSRARIGGPLRRYAGVLVDVFFDHVLAASWDEHAADAPPLRDFVDSVYADLRAHGDALPARLRFVTERMIAEDWLGSYGTRDGLRRILGRMEGRLRRPAPLSTAVELLDVHGPGLEADFAAFYPQLRAFAVGLRTPGEPPETRGPGSA